VRQLGVGLSYEERWPGGGSFGASLQKVDYRRSIDAPGAPEVTDRTTPLLAAFRFTANPSRQLLVYGSYTRGLEDSALAPANARNRGESPPATATWQVDAGVRVVPRAGVQVLLGAFEIRKAYFNLDDSGVYAQLGQIRHRGVEASATINSGNGLTAVLGGVWLRPSVLRSASGADAPGSVPLGTVPLLLDANVDYAPPRFGPWGLGFELRRVSSRPATTDNRLSLSAYSTLSLNARYKTSLAGHRCLVRLDAQDITDEGGLELLPSSLVLPERGRRMTVTFAADF
jgi:iron complex outermembrane receptor protein